MGRFFLRVNRREKYIYIFFFSSHGVFNPNVELILNSIEKKEGKENR